MLVFALVLSALSVAQVDATWSAGLRTELRARTPGLADQNGVIPFSLDFELQPTAGIVFAGRRLRLVTGYAPRVFLPNFDSGRGRPGMLHRWGADLAIRASRTLSVDLSEMASYGITDFSSLIGLTSNFDRANPPRLEAIPLGGLRVTTVSSRTQLALFGRGSRRLTTNAGLYYSVSGGVSAVDQATLPLQFGPGLFVDVAYMLARFHQLGGRFNFEQTDFSTGQSFTVAALVGRWVWTYRTGSTLTAQAGVSVVRGYLPTDAFYSVTVAPYGRLAWQQTFDSPAGAFILQVNAGMAPFLDRVLAAYYERLELGASVLWRVNDTVQFRLQGQWTMALFDRNYQGQQLSLTEAGVLVRLSPRLSFDAGGRVLWANQQTGVAGVVPPAQLLPAAANLQWLAFIGLSGTLGGEF
ncbi:MAG: hypothetical protein IT381_26665 [Deltaproteobacteria bacterium]|nr:hypothetical protein [Deltaproteobacteria bacterium]